MKEYGSLQFFQAEYSLNIVEFWMFSDLQIWGCVDHQNQIHNLRVIVVMVIRLSVDHWIRHYNLQYL